MTERGGLVLWSAELGERPDSVERWRANAAGGCAARVSLEATPHGNALRFDFSLAGPGSWVILRTEHAFTLPPHYAAVLRMRGSSAPVELQVKLVDDVGSSVWWWRRRDFAPPAETTRLVLRRASLEAAWGPASGGDPHRVGAVEVGLAGESVAGTLWIEELRIEERRPAGELRVVALRASSSADGHAPESVLNDDRARTWRPAPGDAAPWLVCDLARDTEWGGLIVDFADGASKACLLQSEDEQRWEPLVEAEPRARAGAPTAEPTPTPRPTPSPTPTPPPSMRGPTALWLRTGNGEGRFARIEFAPGSTPSVARVRVVPLELAVAPVRYLDKVAKTQPRGRFPRHLLGEQVYWAVVSAEGAPHKGLLSEDGALEVDAESFSIEPFLEVDGQLVTWADVTTTKTLPDGFLPIPSVEWRTTAGIRLCVTGFASAPPTPSAGMAPVEETPGSLLARYEVRNESASPHEVRLLLAIRPFQVNPAWQGLNMVGGIARIARIERTGDGLRVDDALDVLTTAAPAAAALGRFDDDLTLLGRGGVAAPDRVDDALELAQGVLAFEAMLASGAAEVVGVALPHAEDSPRPPRTAMRNGATAWIDERLAETAQAWRARLARVPIELPPSAAPFAQSLRAQVAWILCNRVGPRIQPGPRCYRRAWIRDGTLTGTALVEMGFPDEAKAFLRWYAPFQLPDGRVPCAVDRHDVVDQAVEHDSHGELAWGVVEVYRLTKDRTLLAELWPHVKRAAEAIEMLRAQRTTREYRDTARYGLMPESISHEGYASQPVHSYWDDFFAVRGLADAAEGARILGDDACASRFGALAEEMRESLHASIRRTLADHGIDFVPGSVELGDFDPTSTAIAFDPCGEGFRLPPAVARHTYERFWAELEARRRSEHPNDAYTPYEVRTASALVMLGWKQRAHDLLAWLITDQRLAEWREWPEISWLDRRAAHFLGDIPHGWVASSFVRAVRRMIAYERDEDGALVLGAGLPAAWVQEQPGVRAHALPTHAGLLDFRICADPADPRRVDVEIGGAIEVPAGGIVVESPLAEPLRALTVDGEAHPIADPHRVVLRRIPSRLRLEA